MNDIGMCLTGGGARGAYQAGALKGIAEILKEENLLGLDNPFKYWSGVSAGSINAAYCVSGMDDFLAATQGLAELWKNIELNDVYHTDFKHLSKNSIKWMKDLGFGSFFKKKQARFFLDTEPLWEFLGKNLNLTNIDSQIKKQLVHGLACSAYSYRDNSTISFVQSDLEFNWNRHRRSALQTQINLEHVMASCAIPLLFPTVPIDGEHFADGSFRNLSPISPMIQFGAKKILIVGVRGQSEVGGLCYLPEPGAARISGLILNALFFDSFEIDLERLRHINQLVTAAQQDIETYRSDYTLINYRVIRPSKDVGTIAMEKLKKFPKMINYLLSGLGPMEESAELASYIMFTSNFTAELLELGYSDVLKQKDELIEWIEKTEGEL